MGWIRHAWSELGHIADGCVRPTELAFSRALSEYRRGNPSTSGGPDLRYVLTFVSQAVGVVSSCDMMVDINGYLNIGDCDKNAATGA